MHATTLSTIAAPRNAFLGCGFDDLLEHVNDRGDVAVVWHLRRTAIALMLPSGSAEHLLKFLLWKPIFVGQQVLQTACVVLFWLGLFHAIPGTVMILAMTISSFCMLVYHGTAIDLAIAWYCVDFAAVIQLILIIVATICTSAVLGWDSRACMIPPLCITVLAENVADGYSYQVRVKGRIYGIMVTFAIYVAIVVLLNLGRFPNTQDIFIDIGTAGGLATFDETFSVAQLASSCWISLATFTFYNLIHVFRGRAGLSQRIFMRPAPLCNEPDYAYLNWLAMEPPLHEITV